MPHHAPPIARRFGLHLRPHSASPSHAELLIRLPACYRVEAVTYTTNGLEICRAGTVRFDFSPDSSDAGIDAARSHELHFPPNRIQENVATENSPRMQR